MKSTYQYLFVFNLLFFLPGSLIPIPLNSPPPFSEDSSLTNLEICNQDWKRYLFETAIVKTVQKVTQAGIDIVTEITIYIKDYGRSEARYIKETRTIKMLNRTEKTNKRTIMTLDKLVTIDEDGTIHEMQNPAGDLMKNMTAQKADQFGQNILKGLNAKVEEVAGETIAGQPCKCTKSTTEMGAMKLEAIECTYKQYPFKISSDGMGMTSEEKVISFQEGVAIDAKHFNY